MAPVRVHAYSTRSRALATGDADLRAPMGKDITEKYKVTSKGDIESNLIFVKKNEGKYTEKMVKEEGWIKCESPFYSAHTVTV